MESSDIKKKVKSRRGDNSTGQLEEIKHAPKKNVRKKVTKKETVETVKKETKNETPKDIVRGISVGLTEDGHISFRSFGEVTLLEVMGLGKYMEAKLEDYSVMMAQGRLISLEKNTNAIAQGLQVLLNK